MENPSNGDPAPKPTPKVLYILYIFTTLYDKLLYYMIILIIRMLFRIIRKNIQMYRMGEKEQIYQLIISLTVQLFTSGKLCM